MPATESVRVWDLPTRLFHWTLAATVVGSVVTAKMGGNAMVWHMRLGYLVFTLLAFRVVWGFVGGRWSRFASFVRAPGDVVRYLLGDQRPGDHFEVGHNPLGGVAVLALLGLLALQVASGLVADDEIATFGPLNRFVSGATAKLATAWHTTAGQGGVIALLALHVAAIGYHWLRRKNNLVLPMLHGDKDLPADTPPARDDRVTRAAALVLAAGCAALVAVVVGQGD